MGFFGAPADEALHSHIAGVAGSVRGRNIGFALKLHQRAWALRRGVSAVAWTYDPLVRRNAYFNLVKLAARPAEYLPNFYGGMHDAINGGDDSDRALVHWVLDDASVVAACVGTTTSADAAALQAAGATVALSVSDVGAPVAGPTDRSTRCSSPCRRTSRGYGSAIPAARRTGAWRSAKCSVASWPMVRR